MGSNCTCAPVGNISSVRDDAMAAVFPSTGRIDHTSRYNYDSLYQLKTATGRQYPGVLEDTYRSRDNVKQSVYQSLDSRNAYELENYAESYKYDRGNNLIEINHTAPTANWSRTNIVDSQSNRSTPQRAPDDVFDASRYDNNGNLTQIDATTLRWNWADNLASAGWTDTDGKRQYYIYDGNGKRLRKVTEQTEADGSKTLEEIRYPGRLEVRLSGNSAGALIEERSSLRILDNQQTIAVTDIRAGYRSYRYQLATPLSSSTLELDQEGTLISYEEYFPFGGTSVIAGRDRSELALKTHRYTGKERDDETGLYYYGARYYAPWTGRWISPDPAGPVDGFNLYTYVGNNPVNYNDPTGNGGDKPIILYSTRGSDRKPNKGLSKFAEGVPSMNFALSRLDEVVTPGSQGPDAQGGASAATLIVDPNEFNGHIIVNASTTQRAEAKDSFNFATGIGAKGTSEIVPMQETAVKISNFIARNNLAGKVKQISFFAAM